MVVTPLGLIVLLVLGLALAWFIVFAQIAWTLTHPPRRGYSYAVARNLPGDPGEAGYTFSTWRCKSKAGGGVELPVWDVVGMNADGPTVVVSHGWGDSRVVMLSRLSVLAKQASRVVLYDLRGHGEASGRSTLGMLEVEDLLAVIEEVLGRTGEGKGHPNPSLVLYGFSLGAGISIAATARDSRVRGVIAEAPYCFPITPARNVLRLRGLPSGFTLELVLKLLGVRFDRAEQTRVKKSECAAMILHGDADVISPLEDGQKLAQALGGELVRVPCGQHNSMWSELATREIAEGAVNRFFETRT